MEEHAIHQKYVHVLQDGLVTIVSKVTIYVCNLLLCHTLFTSSLQACSEGTNFEKFKYTFCMHVYKTMVAYAFYFRI